MSEELPAGLNPKGLQTGTIRHLGCPHCGEHLELKLAGLVPSSFYNVVVDYVRQAAGDEFVLLPVQTLNAMGEERERLALELEQYRVLLSQQQTERGERQ